MFRFGKKRAARIEANFKAKLQKALKERDAARAQHSKHKALAISRAEQLEELSAELAAARELAMRPPEPAPPPPPPPLITVAPGTSWPIAEPPWFFADNLAVWAKTPVFINDERFQRAYRRGMQSGHHIARPKGSDLDLHIEWRIHVVIWAALRGAALEGDFVECGVNTGMNSLAICDYLDFNRLDKQFWLFDTYCGVPEFQMTAKERELGRANMSDTYYSECFELTQTNFAPWPRARLVRGIIPDTLSQVEIGKVCYLSIDLNIALPEVAAMEHFWPKLTSGACVVLDDYCWGHHEEQRDAMDAFAARNGVSVLCLPTGQGLMFKP